MTKQMQKKILILALFAGETMMKSGAEIYRVEDTVERICKAADMPYVEVFAIPTGIFVSIDQGEDNREMFTYIKRIRGTGIDLGRISELNQFSRDFASKDLTVDSGMNWVKQISKTKPYRLPLRLLGASLVSSFFCLMFGGDLKDYFCAFFIGAISYLLSILFDEIETNFFIKGFCCCALATILALVCSSLGLGSSSSAIIIGALMLFVPGVAITNGIRDMLAGDMLAGVVRIAEAFCIAISLAAGAGVVLRAWVAFGGAIL
ncbi:threonine/serine exporter family protein [Clostridium aminobutyricum]|uniref:Threonine/serine exporter family protein n=1 Tax=Clostridium aminobutyricum TaxID=33953 RepID=A0A939D8D8_CLOAM|nr:threonine/serine exporter family protein [Clostridium aminobutyricum]MBN7773041.1 threonine/serine exporter family protein [Clostridium aminobutyricum]